MPEDDDPLDVRRSSRKSVFTKAWKKVSAWHAKLSKTMPEGAAWAALSSPIWLPLLIVLLIRWGRARARRPRPKKDSPQAESARAGGRPKKKKRPPTLVGLSAGAEPVDDPRPELSREQAVLSAAEGEAPSLYTTFLGLGTAADTVESFCAAAQLRLDAAGWAAAVAEGRPDRMRNLRRQWVLRLGMQRVVAWLREHPLLDQLVVQAPDQVSQSAVDSLTVTQPDGLAADLSDAQRELVGRGRQALAAMLEGIDRPFHLLGVARRQKLPALISGDDDGDELDAFYIATLIEGLASATHSADVGLGEVELAEFRGALAEHRKLGDIPVGAEGPAVHVLVNIGGESLAGIGTMMASAAGAAYSTSAVVLRLSKKAGDYGHDRPLTRLGALAIDVILDIKAGDGETIWRNAGDLFGISRLADELKRIDQIIKARHRQTGKSLWPENPNEETKRPDAALLELHRAQVSYAAKEAEVARARLYEILAALCNRGKDSSAETIAMRRLGYALAGIGAPLLRSTSTEMLSAAREVISTIDR